MQIITSQRLVLRAFLKKEKYNAQHLSTFVRNLLHSSSMSVKYEHRELDGMCEPSGKHNDL